MHWFCTGESLRCTGCSQSYGLPLGDINLYTDGELDLSAESINRSRAFRRVLRQRAWCVECNVPVLAERVPTAREFMNAAAIGRLDPDRRPPELHDELLKLRLDEQQYLFSKFSARFAPGHCLSCGSTKWIPFDIVDGKLAPPLTHDACNSPFEWSGVISGVNLCAGYTKVRAWSFDGELLAEAMV